MHNIKNIRFKGYKVFPRTQYAEIENISRVNVIIGKNNCGKTSLLDVFETIYNHKMSIKSGLDVDEIVLDFPFDREMVDSVFSGYSGIASWNRDFSCVCHAFIGNNYISHKITHAKVAEDGIR